LLGIEVQQTFSFPFSLLRHYQMDASMLKVAVFELVQQFYHATDIGNVAMLSALALISLSRQSKDNCFR